LKQSFFREAFEQKRMKTTDLETMTRKTINMNRGPHPRADIHRLYLRRNEDCIGFTVE